MGQNQSSPSMSSPSMSYRPVRHVSSNGSGRFVPYPPSIRVLDPVAQPTRTPEQIASDRQAAEAAAAAANARHAAFVAKQQERQAAFVAQQPERQAALIAERQAALEKQRSMNARFIPRYHKLRARWESLQVQLQAHNPTDPNDNERCVALLTAIAQALTLPVDSEPATRAGYLDHSMKIGSLHEHFRLRRDTPTQREARLAAEAERAEHALMLAIRPDHVSYPNTAIDESHWSLPKV